MTDELSPVFNLSVSVKIIYELVLYYVSNKSYIKFAFF